jgi:ribonuclease HI
MISPSPQAGLTLQTFSDGGARGNPGPAAVGVVICDEQGTVLEEASRTIGDRTNNQAEYEAMFLALTLARERKARNLRCHADSELIVYQLQGRYRIKDERLKSLAEKVRALAAQFESIIYKQVPREHPMIARADKLVNQSLDKAAKASRGMPPGAPGSGGFRQEEFF